VTGAVAAGPSTPPPHPSPARTCEVCEGEGVRTAPQRPLPPCGGGLGRGGSAARETAAIASIHVTLPPALCTLFPGAPRELALPATTVAELMQALDARWPGMRDRLCDSRPAIRRHINVFVDGERARLDTELRPGAEVLVMTAISGG